MRPGRKPKGGKARAARTPPARAAIAAARTGKVIFQRASATISSTARAEKNVRRVNADGPCLKKGGGERSSVARGMCVAQPRGGVSKRPCSMLTTTTACA